MQPQMVHLELAAVSNDNLLGSLAVGASDLLNNLHNVHTLGHAAENNVLAIEPLSLDSAKEELGAVGPGASVRHGENTGTGVLELEVLISELSAIDGLASSAVVVGEVTTLAHELRNHTVEGAALVAKALLASAESTEVLSSLGDDIGAESHLNAASRLTVDGDIKENDRVVRHGCKVSWFE